MSRKIIEQLKKAILNQIDIGQEFTYSWVADVVAPNILGADLETIVAACFELVNEGGICKCSFDKSDWLKR